ncbi:IS200/IS605 family transposase [Microaerobacter geothermalis]|uniref:IS200/IS605 family transposase n=1 Tax=Microaerobacter geothermalis TaxID=674972 RepID=UPI001F3EDFA9|nr:IS200/IS605 family transposase [Microaerobacter geothermalis]MCF6094754.1 IS200/IS605 family transposase [Microaerobacter geothermalis]
MNDYKSLNHCRYLVQYHLVWCPKFRFQVLKGDVEVSLKQIFQQICEKYEYEIIELEVMPDHIHIFLSAKPTVAPTDIVRTLKSISAIELFKQYPLLKRFYGRCGSLWSKGHFVSTIGKVSSETIKRYIQEQKTRP